MDGWLFRANGAKNQAGRKLTLACSNLPALAVYLQFLSSDHSRKLSNIKALRRAACTPASPSWPNPPRGNVPIPGKNPLERSSRPGPNPPPDPRRRRRDDGIRTWSTICVRRRSKRSGVDRPLRPMQGRRSFANRRPMRSAARSSPTCFGTPHPRPVRQANAQSVAHFPARPDFTPIDYDRPTIDQDLRPCDAQSHPDALSSRAHRPATNPAKVSIHFQTPPLAPLQKRGFSCHFPAIPARKTPQIAPKRIPNTGLTSTPGSLPIVFDTSRFTLHASPYSGARLRRL